MIDIHCHILSEIDDGAKHLRESVEMAKMAYKDGTRRIIATPHFCEGYQTPLAVIDRKIAELQAELDREGIAVRIFPGNEVRLESPEFVYRHAENGDFHYLNEARSFVLLEQRWAGYCDETEEVIAWFLARGTTPIIPHPERHPFFRDNSRLLLSLIDAGAWTQVTADSLLGNNGEEAMSFARWMVQRDIVHTLASDAHNTNRKPNLSEGVRIVTEMAGEARAREIAARMDSIVP